MVARTPGTARTTTVHPPRVDAEGSSISVLTRETDIASLADTTFDVLIVGGGVVGAGSALDAASRGLSVLLVEAQDWASGTSSRSTKLVHGGLRYLQMLDFVLVHEALKERGLLLEKIAPHLVTKMPFLYPLRHRVYERAYTALGIGLYDALAHSMHNSRGVPRQRQLSRRQMYLANPSLRPGLFTGAIVYYDAQVDDARLVLTLVRSAVAHGAVALSRMAAVGVEREADRVTGARLRDLESGREVVVRARSVLLATGVWTEEAESLVGKDHVLRLRPSKGVHLVVPREKIKLASAVMIQTEKSILFVIPWGDHWIIGTTDTPWEHEKSRPVANASDIKYLLDHANAILDEPLTIDDIESVYAGLRPLIAGAGEETTKLSREHAIGQPVSGLTVISGGKYTTYRVMAKDAIDAVVRDWPDPVRESATESLPLIGADGVVAFAKLARQLSDRYDLPLHTIEHLVSRYGTLLEQVLAPGERDRQFMEPLAGAVDYLRAEVLYAVTHEGAIHVEDLLRRRIRLGLETRDRGLACLDEVIAIMGDALSWDGARRQHESDQYHRLVAAERRAETQPDDEGASAVMSELSEKILDRGPAT